jgi:hypothetical protein
MDGFYLLQCPAQLSWMRTSVTVQGLILLDANDESSTRVAFSFVGKSTRSMEPANVSILAASCGGQWGCQWLINAVLVRTFSARMFIVLPTMLALTWRLNLGRAGG